MWAAHLQHSVPCQFSETWWCVLPVCHEMKRLKITVLPSGWLLGGQRWHGTLSSYDGTPGHCFQTAVSYLLLFIYLLPLFHSADMLTKSLKSYTKLLNANMQCKKLSHRVLQLRSCGAHVILILNIHKYKDYQTRSAKIKGIWDVKFTVKILTLFSLDCCQESS